MTRPDPGMQPAPRRRRLRGGWLLLLLLPTLLFISMTFALVDGLQQGLPDLPWAVVVNGQDLWALLQDRLHQQPAQLVVAALLALLLTIALALLPLLVLLAVAMALLLPVLAAGLLVLLTLSPLLAVGALLWWLIRPSRSASIGR